MQFRKQRSGVNRAIQLGDARHRRGIEPTSSRPARSQSAYNQDIFNIFPKFTDPFVYTNVGIGLVAAF
jgi:hypothetical protein